MAKRAKNAVRKERGTMCNICGKNCGRGGPLRVHLQGAHQIDYDDYKKTFYEDKKVITDTWNVAGKVSKTGQSVVIHVLVRRFAIDLGKRGVRTTST